MKRKIDREREGGEREGEGGVRERHTQTDRQSQVNITNRVLQNYLVLKHAVTFK